MATGGTNRPPGQVPRVGIVGLGLIGGSLGLALGGAGSAARRLGWDRAPGARRAALDAGVIDEVMEPDALVAATDILVLATPVCAALDILEQVLRRVRDGAGDPVITDVASVKNVLLERARRVCGTVPPRLVPGHPIAGAERSGVAAASAALFRDHRVILTPPAGADDAAVAAVAAMWESAGAAVVQLDAAAHDHILAQTSHLPHFLAYTLVDTLVADPACTDIFRFAAGGFRDFTRIASSNPVMWRDIALTNREALLGAIDAFTVHLQSMRAAIEAGDGDGVESVLRRAKTARDRFAGLVAPEGGH